MTPTTTQTPGPAPTGAPTSTTRTSRWPVLGVELRDELLAVLREPATLFFSVAMPVGFFALFVNLWGGQAATTGSGELTAASMMLATFGTFGVLGVTLLVPGIGMAEDRDRGWLRTKRVGATPLPVTLAGKVLATVPYAVTVLVAMTVVAAVQQGMELDAGTWLLLVTVLVLGGVPFALIGLTVGFLASPNAAAAILQAILIPSAIASGLWFPLEMLPDVVRSIAPWLPTYHLAQLGVSVVDGGPMLTHALALLAGAAVAATLAALAYRRLPS